MLKDLITFAKVHVEVPRHQAVCRIIFCSVRGYQDRPTGANNTECRACSIPCDPSQCTVWFAARKRRVLRRWQEIKINGVRERKKCVLAWAPLGREKHGFCIIADAVLAVPASSGQHLDAKTPHVSRCPASSALHHDCAATETLATKCTAAVSPLLYGLVFIIVICVALGITDGCCIGCEAYYRRLPYP